MPLTLLEINAQAVPQYGYPRANGATPSGTIAIHTTEGRPDLHGPDTTAAQVGQFILTRTDLGSYHTVCDADTVLRLAPYDTETWGIAGLNGWAIHIATAVRSDEWSQLTDDRRDAMVTTLARAAADAAQWCFEELGVVVPARRLTKEQADAREPGFIAHSDTDPAGAEDPGPSFDWDAFLDRYRRAMRERDVDITLGGTDTATRGGAGSFLALFPDGDYAHRTITEHERALAASGHYRGAIEADHGKQAVAGPVLFTAYQQLLRDAGFYDRGIDGDFGTESKKSEQRFLAALGVYRGKIDGDRSTLTVKAFQGALNQRRLGTREKVKPLVTAMVNPAAGRVSSEYGPRKLLGNVFHSGIDIANATGTAVRAAFDGTVMEVGTNIEPGRSGNAISIRSDDGGATYYGHLSRMHVGPGQHVSGGQHIGDMGATGNVTGPHLHFEVWSSGKGSSHHNPRIDFERFGMSPGVG